ncbi:hypothetical protein PISMIDRAFT_678830 [Pisolithus microcarpus 441]|uniref:Unplaced genomic scaffold scaffold_38, whole genome shotgun sequence n=1 Tax=Pisolithus microcarpus 441 TaxID=765257 RepID=A0A0C9Z403_9AGAM|nr:hypothetical protein PISMIDRAFT_678830 [Pisolithus microcarpus 441]
MDLDKSSYLSSVQLLGLRVNETTERGREKSRWLGEDGKLSTTGNNEGLEASAVLDIF